jgi:hypothetical protein
MIGTWDTEAEALGVVRDLLASGWTSDELSLGLEWSEGDDGDGAKLPPVLRGVELADRVRTVVPAGPKRRSA